MGAVLKKRLWLGCMIALGLGLAVWWWYSHSLHITHVALKEYRFQPEKELSSHLVIAVSSRAGQLPFIPDSVRQFFRIHTELCLLTPEHQPLVNDDTWLSCFPDQDEAASRARSHAQETSYFEIPFATKATHLNGQQHFLRSLRQHKGLWFKLRLVGYFGPPTIETEPVFLDLAAYRQHFDK